MSCATKAVMTLSLAAAGVHATQMATAMATKNPIRKVVDKLQAIEKEVQGEGDKAKAIFDDFTCQCKNNKADLTKSIADAEEKISSLPSDIEEAEKLLVQVKEGLKKAKVDRSAAKNAMAEATAMRENEASAYKSAKDEFEANINAINKAVAAIEKGAGGAFLQTGFAQRIERVTTNLKEMDEDHRDAILSFLSGESSEDSKNSGEVTGMLKELGDEMNRNLADATTEEDEKIRIYNELIAAKTKEVGALGQAVEDKTQKIGDLGLQIVEMKDDQKDSEKAFVEDKKFLVDLEKECAARTAEYEKEKKTRADELAAIADTIKMLNSDEALELMKKTLPGASSFLQVEVTSAEFKHRAASYMRKARDVAMRRHRAGFGIIALALSGKGVDFGKVNAMIDDMVNVLKSEQEDDDKKKEYCAAEFDETDDKQKALERKLSQEATAMDKTKGEIATLSEEIDALEVGLRKLDRSVKRATMQRQKENRAFNTMMTENTAAKALLEAAKARLEKFYNAFVQLSTHAMAHKESNKVLAMLDGLIADLDKEMTEGKASEKEAQTDYEMFTKDSKDKRSIDMSSVEEKAKFKADAETTLVEVQETNAKTKGEHDATLQYETNLHAECDWLVQNYEMRKSARVTEIDSLKKAKDVLAGADFSFLQTGSAKKIVRRLRHRQ